MYSFLTQLSVSAGGSSEQQLFSSVSPSQSNLCLKYGGVFFIIAFSTSVMVSYFSLFLGLTGFRIGSFLITEVYGFFFLLFLQGIRRLSGVILDKLSPCPKKSEISLLSLRIYISVGFSILILVLDKLVIGVDLDLYI